MLPFTICSMTPQPAHFSSNYYFISFISNPISSNVQIRLFPTLKPLSVSRLPVTIVFRSPVITAHRWPIQSSSVLLHMFFTLWHFSLVNSICTSTLSTFVRSFAAELPNISSAFSRFILKSPEDLIEFKKAQYSSQSQFCSKCFSIHVKSLLQSIKNSDAVII